MIVTARTRQELIPQTKEQCPMCKSFVDKMIVHLATHHKGVVQVGEIFWLNRFEAIYKGRIYKRGRYE